MRHYYRVNTDGDVTGCVTHNGGFNDQVDPGDVNNFHPISVSLRHELNNPNRHAGKFDRLLPYDCPCASEIVQCQCAFAHLVNIYFDGKGLAEKPARTVELDGVAVTSDDGELYQADRPPGTKVVLRVLADVPDGYKLPIRTLGRVTIIRATTEVTFTGGASQPLSLSAPAQGMAGTIVGEGKLIRPFVVQLTGWK